MKNLKIGDNVIIGIVNTPIDISIGKLDNYQPEHSAIRTDLLYKNGVIIKEEEYDYINFTKQYLVKINDLEKNELLNENQLIKFEKNEKVKLPNNLNSFKEGTVGYKLFENIGYGIFERYEDDNKCCIVKVGIIGKSQDGENIKKCFKIDTLKLYYINHDSRTS